MALVEVDRTLVVDRDLESDRGSSLPQDAPLDLLQQSGGHAMSPPRRIHVDRDHVRRPWRPMVHDREPRQASVRLGDDAERGTQSQVHAHLVTRVGDVLRKTELVESPDRFEVVRGVIPQRHRHAAILGQLRKRFACARAEAALSSCPHAAYASARCKRICRFAGGSGASWRARSNALAAAE